MKRLFAANLLLLLSAVPSAQQPAQFRTVVLNHVTIVDSTASEPRRDMAIVIEGSRIAAVNSAGQGRVPEGAEIVDARGKFVIPGLADMHNHLRSGGLQVVPEDGKKNLSMLLAWGVTTIFNMSGDLRSDEELKTASSNDRAPYSLYYTVRRGLFTFGGFRPSTPEEARANVTELKAAKADAVKFAYDDMRWLSGRRIPMPKPDVLVAAIDEAHKQGLRVYVHAPILEFAKETLRAGADGLVHGIISDPIDDEFIELMKKNRAVYISTLALFEACADIQAWAKRLADFDRRGTMKTLEDFLAGPDGASQFQKLWGSTPYVKEHMPILRANLKAVSEAGVPIVTGTDTGFPGVVLGVSSVMEVVLHVEAGLTPGAALQAATANAARMVGRESELGTIERGKLADLVVLDADPFVDARNFGKIHRVIRGGVIHDPADLLAASR